jgi:hypothetical protein
MNKCLLSAAIGLMISVTIPANAALPAISGTPEIETPQLLAWPTDRGDVQPNLNDPTANTLHDFHGELSSCDMVFSTEGNYYPALRDIWPVYLAKFNNDPLKNSFYTTSPPVFTQQAQNGMLQFGNLYATCRPQLAAGSMKAIKKLQDAGLTVGDPIPFYRDRGNVILVKKGNPKKIKSVWDLARADVHYASPNPTLEPGAFGNYVGTIYGIAENDAKHPKNMSPEALINAIFNNTRHVPHKWLAGARIHHRDVPWLVAYGKADAGVILYHLALYTQHAFPEQFDIVPLGGTIHDPQPLAGSVTSVRYLVRVKGDWNSRQRQATDTLIETLLSEKFTNVLVSRGLARPDGFATAESGK